jgi:hypothetical protein
VRRQVSVNVKVREVGNRDREQPFLDRAEGVCCGGETRSRYI